MASDCLWCIDFRQMAAAAAASRASVYSFSGTIDANATINATSNAAAALVDDAYEQNDTRATATDLGTIGGTKQVAGVMADAADWYKFTIGSTGTSTSKISLAFTHASGDLDIALYNAAGTRVAISQGVTNAESLSLNGLAAGTYTVQVYGYRGVTNPSYALTLTHAATTTAPDLRGTALSAPDTANWGNTIGVAATIRNSGTGAAGASVAEWYLSQDTTYSSGDVRLSLASGATSAAVPALAAGASSTQNVTLVLPGALPAGWGSGAVYLVLRTDATNLVAESNEANNGGQLGAGIDREAITITTATPPPTGTSQFTIALSITGMTASQTAIFNAAATRWSQIIVGDLPNATYNGVAVDDLLINASAVAIDGVGGILGQAGPDRYRSGTSLPYHGSMQFDSADLASMEANGSLYSVILHEMGHVLGLGTLWSSKGLLTGAGTSNPLYVGANALAAYNAYTGGNASGIPVENSGGSGTRDSHWRESTFTNEIMTGWVGPGSALPISRITIGALADLGYSVNYAAADAYSLPRVVAIVASPATGSTSTTASLVASSLAGGLRSPLSSTPAIAGPRPFETYFARLGTSTAPATGLTLVSDRTSFSDQTLLACVFADDELF